MQETSQKGCSMEPLYATCLTKLDSSIHYKFTGSPVMYTNAKGFCDDVLEPFITPEYYEKTEHADFVFISMLYISTTREDHYVPKSNLVSTISEIIEEIEKPTLLLPSQMGVDIINLHTIKFDIRNTHKNICYIVESPEKLGFYHLKPEGISMLINQTCCHQIVVEDL